MAERAGRIHRLGRILEESTLESGIGPSLGNDTRADVRPDLRFVCFDDAIERGRIDIAFLGEYGLKGAHAQLHLREIGSAVMIVIVIVLVTVLVTVFVWSHASLATSIEFFTSSAANAPLPPRLPKRGEGKYRK